MTAPNGSPHLIWVYPMALNSKLDAATWLDTTHELRQMGWKVTLVTSGSHDGTQKIRGIEVFCISIPPVYFLRYILFHWRFLKLRQVWDQADVILFGPLSAPWLLPLRLMRILRHCKRPLLAMDTRSLNMELPSRQGWKGYLRDKYVRLMNVLTFRWADGQTVITDRMGRSLGIPPEKLWGVWPSGVDVNRFHSCPTWRRWPTEIEPVRLGYIGALEYGRNLMGFAVAVEKANTKGMCFQFTLVGDGTQRAALEEYARSSSGRIAVASSIPYDKIPDFLSGVHVGVLPFPNEEKFQVCSPIKLFEYMAAGLPILATRISCHTDVLKEGPYVFWAESANEDGLLQALSSLWRQRHTLEDLSMEAISAAQAWTWRESAVKLKSALERGMMRSASSAASEMNTLRRQTPS